MNEELDNCRKKHKKEAKKIKKKSRREAALSPLNKSKYVLIKNKNNLKEEQKVKLKNSRKDTKAR